MTNQLNKVIGNRIRVARKKMRLTQAEVGDHLGLTKNAVGKIESGEVALTLKNLFELPAVLHHPIEYFLGLNIDLTDDEKELLTYYRVLPDEFKRIVLDQSRKWQADFIQMLEEADPVQGRRLREMVAPYLTEEDEDKGHPK